MDCIESYPFHVEKDDNRLLERIHLNALTVRQTKSAEAMSQKCFKVRFEPITNSCACLKAPREWVTCLLTEPVAASICHSHLTSDRSIVRHSCLWRTAGSVAETAVEQIKPFSHSRRTNGIKVSVEQHFPIRDLFALVCLFQGSD
jgi:hypothetical protein